MAQDPAINTFVAELARHAMAGGKRVPDLQLESPNAPYLDENTVYLPPMNVSASPAGKYSDIAVGTGPNPPLEPEGQAPYKMDLSAVVPKYHYADVTTPPAARPSIEMSWRHKREPEGAAKSDVVASKDAPVTPKSNTPLAAKLPTASATGGAKKDTSPAAAGDKPDQGSAADPLLERYKNQQGDLNKMRDEALAKMKSQEGLSDNEKIGLALISVLPALIGGVAGSAFGGAGAAAGAAGGLQGASAGWQMVQGAKNEKRKEAKAEADKLDQQKLQLGLLGDRRQETLEERGIHKGEVGRKETLDREKMAQDARLAGDLRGTQMAIAKMNNATDYQKAILNYKGDQLKAQATQGGAGKGLKDDEKSFYSNTAGALRNLDELENLVGKVGNYESDSALSPFSDPKAAAQLNQLNYDTAVAYAKIVDPSTAAREGEVESAKKFAIPMGATVSTEATMEAIKHMKKMIAEKAATRNEIGVPLSPEALQQLQGGAKAQQQQKGPADIKFKWGF